MATILIVDDISANRAFLARLLQAQGHRPIEGVNGREGLAAIRVELPDLVITDVLMPVMDGYEFARELQRDPATARIPVLFYTAPYGEREARTLAQWSGGYVLTKPAKPDQVLQIVNSVLSSAPLPVEAASGKREANREHLRLLGEPGLETSAELRLANARLRAVVNIGLDLAGQRNPDLVLPGVCAAVGDLFGASYTTLGILDLASNTVRHFVTCGTEEEDWIKPGDTLTGVLGAVVTEGRALRCDEPGDAPGALQFPPGHPPVQAFLAVPITTPAHVYGWICLVRSEGGVFTQEDEDLVMVLAGKVGRYYELEHEVLERKLAEAEARREHDQAQRYLDIAEVILLKLDMEGRILLVNRYGCEMLGKTEEELVGRDWISTCMPARLETECRQRLSEVQRGELLVAEYPVLTSTGDERLIEWRNRLLRDDNGSVIGTFSSGADITDRHQADASLRIVEERMRFALEAAAVGIWDMDFATGVNRWSEILESQYGLEPGTFEGTFEAFIGRIHPEDRKMVEEAIEKARSGGDFSFEHRVVLPDGTLRWLSGAGRLHLDRLGTPVRGIGISIDVTARHTLESQYLQAQKMEAIGRLAGGVAHDFNNLLTAILGYCELLLVDFNPADPRQEDVIEIQKAGLSAARLTRQLLAFSRKQIIEPKLLDLNRLVGDLKGMLGRLIREDVKVVLGLHPGLPLVKADHGQIEQVILNLAVNARDAMENGGTLTIETASVMLDEDYASSRLAVTPGRYVMLAVTDTGIGISPEVRAHLFEPFFTTKETGKGTGLGLATVHGIVTRMGGSVNVYSEMGRGTSFKVYLPEAGVEEGGAGLMPAAVPMQRNRGQVVLVVEDGDELRVLTKRLLERQGYKVLVAANADEASEIFDRNPAIEVLLTDVVMPGTSGPELNERLLVRRPDLKVVYMSGYTDETIMHHGVLNPGIAFLQKPFTADALGRKIADLFPALEPVEV